jgi:sugar phosphate isomerase/epimerase
MLSLSSCWRASSGMSGTELVDLFRSLGFEAMEVEYRLSPAQVREIKSCVRAGRIRVSSLHNYVPKIEGEGSGSDGGDRFLLSALDEEERRLAVDKTRRTLEWAARLGAPAVILHLGRVEGEVSQLPLLDLFRAGMGESPEAERIRRALAENRARAAGPHMEQVIRSVCEIERLASDLGLRVGLENRYYYRQIPAPDELELLLSETDPRTVGYWHDVGHGQVMENLGLRRHSDHLEIAGDRLLGVHLHDLVGVDDHMAPGTGEFRFESLRAYWRPGLATVMELHPRVTEGEVVRGREVLESLGFGSTGSGSA